MRDAVTLLRMHYAFESGLMQYGLMRGTKKADGSMKFQGQ